jgi:hypothetical protein
MHNGQTFSKKFYQKPIYSLNMPIKLGQDNGKYFFQYGNQKKYYFTTAIGRVNAYKKALKQAQAIVISQKRTSFI